MKLLLSSCAPFLLVAGAAAQESLDARVVLPLDARPLEVIVLRTAPEALAIVALDDEHCSVSAQSKHPAPSSVTPSTLSADHACSFRRVLARSPYSPARPPATPRPAIRQPAPSR
jgi:hypothetical protein